MKIAFKPFRQKITSIQHGLLRLRDEKGQSAFPVRAIAGHDASFNCVIEDEVDAKKYLNSPVTLIQKKYDEYLYITGVVTNRAQRRATILSVQVNKASWFVRRQRGNISWFEEKFTFETGKHTNLGILV